jgi:hypothetical protein
MRAARGSPEQGLVAERACLHNTYGLAADESLANRVRSGTKQP